SNVKTLYGKFRDALQAWTPVRGQIIAAELSNRNTDAYNEFINTGEPLATAVNDSVNQLVAAMANDAKQSAHHTATAGSSGARTMILCVIFGSLAALALGISIARAIARRLRSAADALTKVGARDLTVELAVDSTDEVGQMGTSLNAAVAELSS